ncbi:MAG: signal peptide peptidase SppA [Lentisphaeria bacterium]|nr:signal peptide peptidase SppA [Lentisphaeria bacterium]
MAEENATVKKRGLGCIGCGLLGCGMILLILLVLIILMLIGIFAMDSEMDLKLEKDTEIFKEKIIRDTRSNSAAGAKIIVIDVRGMITDSDSLNDDANANRICAMIRKAAADPEAKALIINLNTPGGEVVASDRIYEELCLFRKNTKKPVVAVMNSIATSGGYYIAAACKPIIANRMTLTGSIGVIISSINYQGLFQKIGLKSEIYTSGKMKDMLNGSRPRTPEEIKIVNTLVSNTYDEFVKIVATSRGIPIEKIKTSIIGDGRIFDGKQALSLGLIDSIGSFRDAIQAAAKEAGITQNGFLVVRYEEYFSFSQLFSMLAANANVKLSLENTLRETSVQLKPGTPYFLPVGF